MLLVCMMATTIFMISLIVMIVVIIIIVAVKVDANRESALKFPPSPDQNTNYARNDLFLLKVALPSSFGQQL